MRRGIVLEIHDQSVTLLSPDGQFLKGRKVSDKYEIGEEVDYFPLLDQQPVRNRFFNLNKMRISLVSSVAAVLLFFTIFTFNQNSQVYAYMSIDINPSIEAGVDKELRVISLEALNEEGETILRNITNWKDEPIDSVAKNVIEKSIESGYYEADDEVIITTVIIKDQDDAIELELKENVEELIKTYDEENISVISFESTKEEREHATKEGLSTGSYIKKSNKESIKKNEKDNESSEENKDKKELDKKKMDKEKNKIENSNNEINKEKEKENSSNKNNNKDTETKSKRNKEDKENGNLSWKDNTSQKEKKNNDTSERNKSDKDKSHKNEKSKNKEKN